MPKTNDVNNNVNAQINSYLDPESKSGFKPQGKTTVSAHGRLYSRYVFERTNPGTWFATKAFNKVFGKGDKEKVLYSEAPQSKINLNRTSEEKRLGYNPKSPKSVRTFAEANKGKFQRMYNHLVMPVYNRKGKSSFIFAPNGDFSQAFIVETWDAKTGQKLTGARFHRAMMDYAALYDSIQEGWDKQINALVAKNKDTGLKEDDFKKLRPVFVIHPKYQAVRLILDDYDPNTTNLANTKNGLIIDIDKELWKEVETIHNKNMTEHKRNLNDLERPYADNKGKSQEIDKGKGHESSDDESDSEFGPLPEVPVDPTFGSHDFQPAPANPQPSTSTSSPHMPIIRDLSPNESRDPASISHSSE